MTLLRKYNIAAPRYTSYPTVPYWNNGQFSIETWKTRIQASFQAFNDKSGLSLYLHLPFCEQLCTYCGCNKYITVNHGHELPYIDTILKEWQLYLDLFGERPRIREIHLGGGTPTFFSPQHLEKLLHGILNTCTLLPDASLSFEGHPNNTTPEHLQALYHLGFRRMSLGIQDFDPAVQKIINRIQSFETVKAVTEAARRIGYTSINFDLIYGLPLQTETCMQETVRKVMQLMPERISFYSYAHVPWIKGLGQRLFSEADLPKDETKRNLYELGRQLMLESGYTEIGMDHFALPQDELCNGPLHRNFMGYTITHTSMLVGLGVSAISDGWDTYAQNEKQLASWRELVNTGKFPLSRGHLLTPEDLLIRRHILDLMCSFETSWTRRDSDCDAIIEGISRLQVPEEDGLINIEKQKIRVTEKGKPYIRNICMAFDARLWRQIPQSQLFSSAI